MLRLKDRTALVTGAGGGIGRAIASALARRGCHLALADVDEAALARTAGEIAPHGVRVSRHIVDVGDRMAVAALPEHVVAKHVGVDVLVNNAGVALFGTFEQIVPADFEWLFAINFWGVVNMTRAFLPLLHKSDEARIVNMSSVFGLIAPPGQTAYSASKFAVRGFSEALRHELARTRVGVSVVHPGGVATAIARKARRPPGISLLESAKRLKAFEAFLITAPEVAGETIVRGVENRKARILVGADAKRLALIERLMPVSYWNVIGNVIDRGSRE
jgi:short-subunit dehydrogenase